MGKKVFQIREERVAKKILFLFSAGLLVRLLLMPFFTHPDLIHTYAKAAALAFEGRVYNAPFGFFWELFHAVFLKFFSFFTPAIKEGLLITHEMDPIFTNFVSSHLSARLLFLFKLPFLFFETLSAVLSTRFLKKSKDKLALFALWMFNPIMIFTLYMHGRNEILPIFLLVLAFLFLKKRFLALSFVSLGSALTLRLYPIFFLPVFLLKIGAPLIKKIKYFIFAASPLVLDLLLMSFLRDTSFSATDKLNPIHRVFFSANLDVGLTQTASLLLGSWTLFYLWLFFAEKEREGKWYKIFKLSFWSLMPWFSLGFVHPQYFAWLSLFFAVLIGQTRKAALIFFLFCISWSLVVLDYGRSLSWALFAPLNNFVFSNLTNVTTDFKVIWQQSSPNFSLTYLARSLMIGVFAFLLFFDRSLTRKKKKVFKFWFLSIVAPVLAIVLIFFSQLFSNLDLGFNIPSSAKDKEVDIKNVSGSLLEQTFRVENAGLFKIVIYLDPLPGGVSGDLTVKLFDKEKKYLLAKNFYGESEIKDAQSVNLRLSPLNDFLEKNLVLEISTENSSLESPITFRATKENLYKKGDLLINKVEQGGDLRVVLFYKLKKSLWRVIVDSLLVKIKGDVKFFLAYFLVTLLTLSTLFYLLIGYQHKKKN